MPPRSRTPLRLVKEPRKPQKKPEAAAIWVHPRVLKPWAANPRKNDGAVEHVVRSIEEYGFASPIVARSSTFEIIAGHTRWKAAMKLGLGRVPVRFLDLDEAKAHALALADNRLGELADWDMPKLQKIFESMDLKAVAKAGWNEKDMRAIEKAARDAQKPVVDADSVPPPPSIPVTQPGDLWKLGKHRLVCGNATSAENVKLARGNLQPWLMVTDPQFTDDQADWRAAYALFAGDVAYVWHPAQYTSVVEDGLMAVDLVIRQQIVWAKQNFVIGRAAYQWQHETCWYAVRRYRSASDPRWCGDRNQSTLWTIQNANPIGGSVDDVKTHHATQKPLECMAKPMRNHGAAGDVVYDPFAGSGTAIVAAEQLERVCVALEVSPAYCDVIVDRWQKLTGGKAKRATV